MKKIIATAAITAALAVSSPASAQSVNLDAILADIALQCGSDATLTQCDQLVDQYIAAVASLPAADRAVAVGRIVSSATKALSNSNAANPTVATEIEQIIGKATTALNTIKAQNPAAAASVNAAVSTVAVAVLEVVETKGLNADAGARGTVGNALNALASTSTDATQASAIQAIANVVASGGSVQSVIDQISTVSSYASPA